jgi:hypothetical protein
VRAVPVFRGGALVGIEKAGSVVVDVNRYGMMIVG